MDKHRSILNGKTPIFLRLMQCFSGLRLRLPSLIFSSKFSMSLELFASNQKKKKLFSAKIPLYKYIYIYISGYPSKIRPRIRRIIVGSEILIQRVIFYYLLKCSDFFKANFWFLKTLKGLLKGFPGQKLYNIYRLRQQSDNATC